MTKKVPSGFSAGKFAVVHVFERHSRRAAQAQRFRLPHSVCKRQSTVKIDWVARLFLA
jgi:hypothetical protein